MTDRLPPVHLRPAARDTAAGCAERAAADRAAAATNDNDNIRNQLERSAERWAARGELIQRSEVMAAQPKAASAPSTTSVVPR